MQYLLTPADMCAIPLQALSQAASGAVQLGLCAGAGGGTSGGTSGGSSSSSGGSAGGCVLTVNDFLLRVGLDNLNLFKLVG